MSDTLIIPGASQRVIKSVTENTISLEIALSITTALNGGVREATLNYGGAEVNIRSTIYTMPAGSIKLNAADVALPATYEVYAWDTNGTTGLIVVASTINPETDPAVNYRYARLASVRFQSVGGVATIFFVKRAFVAQNLMLHHIGEYDEYLNPRWFDGGAVSVNATTGAISTTALEYTRLRFEAFVDPIVAGAIVTDNEAVTAANLELLTTYADGSAITAGKYHKLLLGMVVGTADRDYPFIVMRQTKPTVEYATLVAAQADAEHCAATSFAVNYLGTVMPLAYVTLLLGDASDLSLLDIRASGVIGSSGGGSTGTTDHGLLSGLGDDDHLQYLRADGTRNLTGNMATTAGVTFDGVDVGSHTHTGAGTNGAQVAHASLSGIGASDHHAPVTLNLYAEDILSVVGQDIGIDIQPANTFFAGPAGGAPSEPAFRTMLLADIPGLPASKISDFNEAAQDAVGAMVGNSPNISLVYTDATPSLVADLITKGELAVTLANGVNNNVNIGTALIIRVTGPTASFSVAGFAGGYAGRVLYVYNAAAQNMTADNESGTSTAANRILTLGGAAATNGIGLMGFIYSAVDSRWILVTIRS